MADEKHRAPFVRDLVHSANALSLEGRVAHREDFVDQQNFGNQMSGHGEGKPQVHAGGVALDRRIHEFLDFGKRDNFVKAALDFGLLHTQNRAVQVDVLAPGKLGMKARSYFQEGADASVDAYAAAGGRGDPR